MISTRKWMTGFSAALLMGALAGCHNGTQLASVGGGTLPDPNPTVCPAWGCGGPPRFYPLPEPTPIPTSTFCPESLSIGGCGSLPIAGPVYGDDAGSATKDVDLQRADLQQRNLSARAAAVANRFQMSYESAMKLTVLSDEVRQLTANGQQMTAQDASAVAESAFATAGVTADEVSSAAIRSIEGDNTAEDALLAKAATNLGMPTAVLRDQLLPAVGIAP